jgi:hypothetical protein
MFDEISETSPAICEHHAWWGLMLLHSLLCSQTFSCVLAFFIWFQISTLQPHIILVRLYVVRKRPLYICNVSHGSALEDGFVRPFISGSLISYIPAPEYSVCCLLSLQSNEYDNPQGSWPFNSQKGHNFQSDSNSLSLINYFLYIKLMLHFITFIYVYYSSAANIPYINPTFHIVNEILTIISNSALLATHLFMFISLPQRTSLILILRFTSLMIY